MKVIKVLVALMMGFFSAFLIQMAANVSLYAPIRERLSDEAGGPFSVAFILVIFLGGWAGSAVILLRGARTVSKVFARGFLLGAAEWLAMVPISMVFGGTVLTRSVARGASDAELAGATIGAGIVSFVTGGIAIAMVMACLVGFAVAYLMGREMQPERVDRLKRCPECAELIQEAARKCKHCGAAVASA